MVCKIHITYSSDETNFCMMQCILLQYIMPQQMARSVRNVSNCNLLNIEPKEETWANVSVLVESLILEQQAQVVADKDNK